MTRSECEMNYVRTRIILGFATLACLTFLFPDLGHAQNRRNERRAQQLSSEGDKLFRQKNYRNAIDQYAQAIVLAPNSPNPRFWKGLAHFYLDEYEMALPDLNAAIDKGYSKPLDVYLVRWRIHFVKKDFDRALSDVRSGLQIDGDNQDFLLALGDISFDREAHTEAVDAYGRYVLRNPGNAEVHFRLAQSHAKLGNVDAQIASAEESIRRGTRSLADAHILVGDGYTLKMMYAEAVPAYERAVTARPDVYVTYQKLAEGYRALAQFEKAIETARRALRLFPTNGLIYTDISWYYSLADRHQDAVDAAQAGIRYNPELYMPYTNLCRAYNDLKRHDLSIPACNSALKLRPDDGESLFYLSRANRALNRNAEANRLTKRAVAGLEDAARLNPTYSDIHYLLGGAYYDDGQMEKSLASYKRSLELSPNFVKALFNVGIAYLNEGKKDAALEYHRRLAAISPKYAGMLKSEIDSTK